MHRIRLGRDSVLEVDKAETRRSPGKGRTTRSFVLLRIQSLTGPAGSQRRPPGAVPGADGLS